mmetsp:Transcript_7417/g.16036  ORF Transcript_7417/g.16036 Transcript_7417/m.16036 type:complete len:305 (-) Transcript_7417:323-1237(-)
MEIKRAVDLVERPCMKLQSKLHLQMQTAIRAARLAGDIILRHSGSTKIFTKSGAADLVTDADREAEETIIEVIRASFPEDFIIGEEDSGNVNKGSGKQRGANPYIPFDTPTWVVDPLDGTTNFVHGYPFVTVSIGYCVSGEPAVGVIFNPFVDEIYCAELGCGATCNGRAISVDASSGLSDCLLVNNIGHSRDEGFVAESSARIGKWLSSGLRGYRSSGSAAQNMAHVASGKVSCFYEHGFGGPWDICAGTILVREAGGVVVDAQNGADLKLDYGKGSVCSGNVNVVKEVIRVAEFPKVDISIL